MNGDQIDESVDALIEPWPDLIEMDIDAPNMAARRRRRQRRLDRGEAVAPARRLRSGGGR